MTTYLIQFIVYLGIMLAVGYYFMKRTQTNSGFIIGNRSLGPFTTAISAGASDMSGWLLLGLPGAVFLQGLVGGFWIGTGLVVGAYLNWLLVAQPLRERSESLKAITLPTYLSNRFNDKSNLIKIVSSVVILIFFTIYVAAGLKGGEKLFAYTFEASPTVALTVTTLVVVSYTFLGGYLAVCWTDLIQGILMAGALAFIVILGFSNTSDFSANVIAANPNAFSIKTGIITALSLLAWGLGYFGQPHILARFIGIRDAKEIPRARRIAMTWMIFCLVAAVLIGLIGMSYNQASPLAGTDDKEKIFLALTQAFFHPAIGGFVLAAVLAAVMSTADSQLLVLSSALTEDLPFFKDKDPKTLSIISRGGIVVFAIIAYIIAFADKGTILALVGYAWGGFGAAFGPLVILSLVWDKITKAGALTGMILGATSIIYFKNFVSVEGEYLYELLPSFFIAFIGIVVVSLLTQKSKLALQA